jgi:hypothetical protein
MVHMSALATINPNSGKALLDDYDPEEVTAAQLGVTPRTLARWRSLRIGPPVTYVGRKPFYHRPSTAAWLRSLERPMLRDRHRSGRGRS